MPALGARPRQSTFEKFSPGAISALADPLLGLDTLRRRGHWGSLAASSSNRPARGWRLVGAEMRSLTKFGLSQVTLDFSEGTDIYRARQLVSERLLLPVLYAWLEKDPLDNAETN